MPPDPGAYAGSAPTYDNVYADAPGSTVSSVDVFYNDLAPYGSWYNDPTNGWVFAPADGSYVPYTNGHWADTDYGFTWVSSDPFGWATDHYGRWVWANRWIWLPSTVWGPAWVQWREGPGYVGWAPAVVRSGHIRARESVAVRFRRESAVAQRRALFLHRQSRDVSALDRAGESLLPARQ